ncbi:MAG: SpoIID/LytB domain-containing protein [Lachnospiraceae bacterium]
MATQVSLQVAERENQRAIIEHNQSKTRERLLKEAEREQDDQRLLGVLANQIAVEAPMEMLKAQAVIARTEIAYAEKKQEEMPQAKTKQQLQTMWGTQYEKNWKRLQKAVQQTEQQILLYKKEPINAAYHAVSAGETRPAQEDALKEHYPYLESVDCAADREADGYLQVFVMSPKQICQSIKKNFPDYEGDEAAIADTLIVKKRDAAQYVIQLQIGEECVTGETFRNWLSLPSACFFLSKKEDQIRIVTKGIGHGFGLSQYTAQKMAEKGEKYSDILHYFFKDAEIAEKDM